MQVTETKNEGLKREYKIVIPASDIEEGITSKLKEVGQTIRLPGFRPGKAPLNILRKRFGASVAADVVQEKVSETSGAMATERGLRPALPPEYDVTAYEDGQDLEYTISLEVIPDIEPMDFATLKLERWVADVAEKEVEEVLERMASAYKSTEAITEDRPAKTGDVLKIGFVGKVDGEAFPGGTAEDYALELGSGSFIPGFEDQLVGAKAPSKVDVKVTFPEDYGAADLAGKDAIFEVDVKEIQESKDAAIDDELAKRAGKENLEDLKKELKDAHGEQYKAASRMRLKRKLLDDLADAHDFAVPEGMVEREFEMIWSQFQQQKEAGSLTGDDQEIAEKSEDEQKAEFREIAERRVRLGLLLAEVGRTNNIDVTPEDLNRAMAEEAKNYPGQEEMVMQYFRGNPQMMEQLRAPVYEDKVIDFILELADVTDKTVSAEELMKDPDEGDADTDEKKD